ncbi:TPA: hypothetical protein L5750_08965 [Pseudomonas aeruginosa]|uniref:Uncharacterized protein n=1 Tax=Pseudomonas aeruginosa (strain UCBPP-PA14) TaxID=208963 RepID=A0A0H2Z7D8_PSEAB|nr:hypothetical protein PA14_47030 [Pseudomonas aeruginosa UCBPP-PA14]EKA41996.1 hypothetical protein PACI27_3794 [Pseudomonas aeruginosa CI27]SCM63690.1 hypothetical protein PA14OR_3799 [Pseudomonas aeruginosa]HBP5772310.1 hypothetical protein [Pseudomonas aeruginosa]HBP6119793.1 hypothetical protein [Pseudomonas aeruginosa]
MVGTVALAIPALAVVAARVGAEQHAARPQRFEEFAEHPRQGAAGHMEQAGVGEDAVEVPSRQSQRQEILLPYLATAVGPGHLDEARRAFESHRLVAEAAEGGQVAPGTAAEIEDPVRRRPVDMAQQRLDVLAHVMAAGALAEAFGVALIVGQGGGGDRVEILGAHVCSQWRGSAQSSAGTGFA